MATQEEWRQIAYQRWVGERGNNSMGTIHNQQGYDTYKAGQAASSSSGGSLPPFSTAEPTLRGPFKGRERGAGKVPEKSWTAQSTANLLCMAVFVLVWYHAAQVTPWQWYGQAGAAFAISAICMPLARIVARLIHVVMAIALKVAVLAVFGGMALWLFLQLSGGAT